MSVDVEAFSTGSLNFVKLRGSLISGISLNTAENKIKNIIDSGAKKLILDISALTYCDSAGLGMFVQTYGAAQKAGCKLRIAGANDKLNTLFHNTQLDTILSLDQNTEAAVAHLLEHSAASTES